MYMGRVFRSAAMGSGAPETRTSRAPSVPARTFARGAALAGKRAAARPHGGLRRGGDVRARRPRSQAVRAFGATATAPRHPAPDVPQVHTIRELSQNISSLCLPPKRHPATASRRVRTSDRQSTPSCIIDNRAGIETRSPYEADR